MASKIKLLAISGSTRKDSSNLSIIKAISNFSNEIFEIKVFSGIDKIPHFNPDLDHGGAPPEVEHFRQEIRGAQAVLICSPEYAMGVPGTLKNAIDWTVSSMEFSKKPTALITASLSGERAHESLLETLVVIEAEMTSNTQLLIPFVRTKVNNEGNITDQETFNQVKNLVDSLKELVER